MIAALDVGLVVGGGGVGIRDLVNLPDPRTSLFWFGYRPPHSEYLFGKRISPVTAWVCSYSRLPSRGHSSPRAALIYRHATENVMFPLLKGCRGS